MVQGDSMGLSGFVSKSSERVDLSPTKSPSRPVTSRPDAVSLKLAEEVKEMQVLKVFYIYFDCFLHSFHVGCHEMISLCKTFRILQ